LRSYQVEGQFGLEKTPQEYVDNMVKVAQEIYRILKKDGVFYFNIADSYSTGGSGQNFYDPDHERQIGGTKTIGEKGHIAVKHNPKEWGIQPKEMIGIPWMTAFAFRERAKFLIRSDIIWYKPNCMPESVTDRCTKSYEHIFMFTKSQKYYYDVDALREPHQEISLKRIQYGLKQTHPDNIGVSIPPVNTEVMGDRFCHPLGRNKRDVWIFSTGQNHDAHFAVFPIELPLTCIKSATKEKDIVLDPFAGSGTAGVAAIQLGRKFIGLDINQEYCDIANEHLQAAEQGMPVERFRQGYKTFNFEFE
jgi:DNA modification methylase